VKKSAEAIVSEFWRLMATNDFDSVAQVLADDFILEWPQSKERIRGAKKFAQMNHEYPAHGVWRFNVHRIVGNDHEAVSDVTVTDGVQLARAISFFTLRNEKITHLSEYWPEPYAAPPGRAHLVEAMSGSA
jgi:ketosteroid isomerase-like protein